MFIDRHHEFQERLHRQGDLSVLLKDDVKNLLDSLLLVDIIVVVPRLLLHQASKVESEVIDVLPRQKLEAVPLLAL